MPQAVRGAVLSAVRGCLLPTARQPQHSSGCGVWCQRIVGPCRRWWKLDSGYRAWQPVGSMRCANFRTHASRAANGSGWLRSRAAHRPCAARRRVMATDGTGRLIPTACCLLLLHMRAHDAEPPRSSCGRLNAWLAVKRQPCAGTNLSTDIIDDGAEQSLNSIQRLTQHTTCL